jgi:uncharacterized protein with HEPN domain
LSSRSEQSLRDILQAINDIHSDAKGMNFEAFRSDPKTVRAVERSLQIISEAAIRLGAEAETLCPGLPWHNIRGIGNWLRHQYERVDVQTVWDTVRDDLPPLARAMIAAIERLENKPEPPG